ncbi:MAG: thermonuclease family protein, partial [Melioribacteraceae bacterium]
GIWEYSDNYDVDTLDSFLSRQPIVLYLEKLTTIEPEEKIIRIIDSNLFELADGRLIKLANVDVPNIIYEDSLLQQVGINAYKYAKQNLLDNNFDFTYLTNNSLDTNYTLVSIISNFVLSDRDFIEEFLEKGFGKYISNCSDTDTNKYLLAEEEPKQNMDGIWEYKRNYNYLLDQTIANFNSNFL